MSVIRFIKMVEFGQDLHKSKVNSENSQKVDSKSV